MTRKNTIETVSRQQACVHSQKSDLQSSLQKAIAVRSNGFDPFDCQSSKKSPGTESWVIPEAPELNSGQPHVCNVFVQEKFQQV